MYGRNGQAQFGIDVLALLKQEGAIEVGQCKCWQTTTPARIREATDEFIPHIDRWRAQGLKRFILFAACSLDDTKLQNQILIERERVNALGIDYEAWGARKLRSKLRPHADLVRVSCGEHYLRIICGADHTMQASDAALAVGMQATIGQLGLAITDLVESRNKDLAAIRELAAEGLTEAALLQPGSSLHKPSWLQMPPDVQGKALRVKASLMLSVRQDPAAAKSLVMESKRVHPDGDTTVLEALLVHREHGAKAAASVLAQVKTIAEWNLKQRFLLKLGRPEEVLQNFLEIPAPLRPNVESAWPNAIALLLTRQIEQAREVIGKALDAKPRYFDLRLAAAMIAYASSVSPLFTAWVHLTWPIPPPWNLVKRDSPARENLREAAETFRALRATVMERASRKSGFGNWPAWETTRSARKRRSRWLKSCCMSPRTPLGRSSGRGSAGMPLKWNGRATQSKNDWRRHKLI